jgi:hypothetical protein
MVIVHVQLTTQGPLPTISNKTKVEGTAAETMVSKDRSAVIQE